jgi:hypothetical protein
MIWRLLAIACMAHTQDCWPQLGSGLYSTHAACEQVILNPLRHIGEMPVKVEGSRWVYLRCLPIGE